MELTTISLIELYLENLEASSLYKLPAIVLVISFTKYQYNNKISMVTCVQINFSNGFVVNKVYNVVIGNQISGIRYSDISFVSIHYSGL